MSAAAVFTMLCGAYLIWTAVVWSPRHRVRNRRLPMLLPRLIAALPSGAGRALQALIGVAVLVVGVLASVGVL